MRAREHAAAEALLERELSPAEFDAAVASALADETRMADLRELVTWFTRRYATADARLAYARRKYAQILESQASGPR